ncbi:MAG: hypothetical protein BTN85_1181 [Candidatus Methanohalarchaeum thermophilum]|uniref:Uncharacterized protein n=1 Tax=Methanohalarchaeum thermophilum TaxID=1903181 RepID=A0A1Q6DWE2_METT1|nr:MAG: hypothetical protein BTN85_1181 [Candidatus Methanohalarchaeum thermophilum]
MKAAVNVLRAYVSVDKVEEDVKVVSAVIQSDINNVLEIRLKFCWILLFLM